MQAETDKMNKELDMKERQLREQLNVINPILHQTINPILFCF